VPKEEVKRDDDGFQTVQEKKPVWRSSRRGRGI
jgi:hypothetical protein